MATAVDTNRRRVDQFARRDRLTSSQSVPRIADPAETWREGVVFWSLALTTALAASVIIALGVGGEPDQYLMRIATYLAVGIAIFYSVRASNHENVDPESRSCWRFVSLSMAISLGLGFLFYVAEQIGWSELGKYRAAIPILPQFLMLIGLLMLPVAPRTAIDRFKLLLDVATVVVGAGVVAWYDIATSSFTAHSAARYTIVSMHVSLSLDLVLILVASDFWRHTVSRSRSNVLGFLAAAFFIHLATLTLLLFEQRLNGTMSGHSQYSGPFAVLFVAVAAWAQRHSLPVAGKVTQAAFRSASTGSSLIPYLAVLPSLALLLRISHEQGVQPLGGLAVGGVIIAGLAFARQVVSAREAVRLSTESTARDGEARFRSLIQHSSDVISIVDTDLLIRFVSPSVQGVLGYQPNQIEGTKLTDIVHPDDVDVAAEFVQELAARTGLAERRTAGGAALKREWRIRHSDGSWHTVDNVGTNLLDEPVIGGIVLNTRDVTEQSVIREQYMHQAFHDPLTDLANRSLFLYQVGHALARTQRQGYSVSVLFLDLDNFKNVNDSLGHAAGDRLLVEAARRLASCVRDTDVIARLGGDEFAVLLEDSADESDDIGRVAERIGSALSSPFNLGGKEVFVSASIGIARTTSGETSDELVRNADVAMYVAKTNGKGKHVVFQPEMHTAALERLVVEADLRRAIEREEFILEYQPIVILQTGEICGAEALVRWQCRDRGTVPPAVFIPIAEETGLVVPLGRMVLRNACHAARRWEREHGRPLRVTVNLSGRQLQEASIVDHVREALEESQLQPQRLVLEITESMLMQHTEVSMARLTDLKALGVSLAIDDFGTGYSSLSYLQRYPIDILKIDKGFVDDVDKGGDGPVLASAIVALGETLRMSTVAEGIETEAQRGQLLQLGCELGQGFLFAPPLGVEAFTSIILAKGVKSPKSLQRRLGMNERAA